MLSDAEFLLGRAAVALDNARRIGQGGLGRMRIGICPSTESAELARGLADFRAMWPRVNLNLCAVDGSSMLRALRESEVDVGILQTDGSQAEGITARVIASYGLAVAVPAAWGYDQSKAIDLIDLKDRPWLMPARELATVWHDSLVEMCRRAGFEPRIVGTVDDPMSARLMIAGGMGATFFHYKGRRSQQGDISLLKFNDLQVLPPSRTAVAYAEGSNSPQLADFVTCLERTHAAASAPQLVGVME